MKFQIKDLEPQEWFTFLRKLMEIIIVDRPDQDKSPNMWIHDTLPYDEDYGYAGLFTMATDEQKQDALQQAMADRLGLAEEQQQTIDELIADEHAAAESVGEEDHERRVNPENQA